MAPFSLSLSGLVENITEAEISVYRGGNEYDFDKYVENNNEARVAVVSHLKGTWGYEK